MTNMMIHQTLTVLTALAVPTFAGITMEEIAPLPDMHGFAGVFAGISEGNILVAGGANFPDSPPWEGGKKVWSASIFALPSPDGQWKKVGTLPNPRGYGVSASTQKGLLCMGGSDSESHHSGCILLEMENGRLHTRVFPPLPHPLAEASGALLGRTVHLIGGSRAPNATVAESLHLTLDLDALDKGWNSRPFPGPARILAVSAVAGDVLYLFSGASLAAGDDGITTRTYLKDAWRFDPENGWKELPEMPRPALAAPSPAPVLPDGRILIMGGDDGSRAGLQTPSEHPGFPREILAFDPTAGTWTALGSIPDHLPAPVTTPSVLWGNRTIIPSGEIRPAIRTPKVTSLTSTPTE